LVEKALNPKYMATLGRWASAWEEWSKAHGFDPTEHCPPRAANFLAEVAQNSSLSASATKKVASALTAYFSRVTPGLPPMGQAKEILLVRAGVEKLRPAGASRPSGCFDIGLVFSHLREMPANKDLEPTRHAAKLAFLLMSCGLRLGDTFKVSLRRSLLSVPGEDHKCVLRGAPKEEKNRAWVDMPISGDRRYPSVCPHCCLLAWLERRSPAARQDDRIWLLGSEGGRGDRPISSSTVSKYTKVLLTESGVPPVFQTRHIRAAAASAASRLGVSREVICSSFRWSTLSQTQRRHYHHDGGQCKDLFARIAGSVDPVTGADRVIIVDDDGDEQEISDQPSSQSDRDSDGDSIHPSSHSAESEEEPG